MTYNFLWFHFTVKIPALFNSKQNYSIQNTKQPCFSNNLNTIHEIQYQININVTAKRFISLPIPYLFISIVTFSLPLEVSTL